MARRDYRWDWPVQIRRRLQDKASCASPWSASCEANMGAERVALHARAASSPDRVPIGRRSVGTLEARRAQAVGSRW